MSARGAGCLSEAHEFFNRCYIAGLLPRNFDLSKPQEKSVSKVLFLLMSVTTLVSIKASKKQEPSSLDRPFSSNKISRVCILEC